MFFLINYSQASLQATSSKQQIFDILAWKIGMQWMKKIGMQYHMQFLALDLRPFIWLTQQFL